MMASINQVVQRITAIEQRFAPVAAATAKPAASPTNGSFADALATAAARQTTSTQSAGMTTGNVPSGDVASMVQAAAVTNDVDPKLAMAVAEAESGFASDVVSPAGAVGVMQLMPDTASALGVKNLYDPRENIDGGVRYLKQMLNTFDGDVAKAVAAYNAGPQAVKNYNGIPPYSETQNYVARVLSLAK